MRSAVMQKHTIWRLSGHFQIGTDPTYRDWLFSRFQADAVTQLKPLSVSFGSR
jgi:hypothetical protein